MNKWNNENNVDWLNVNQPVWQNLFSAFPLSVKVKDRPGEAAAVSHGILRTRVNPNPNE